MIGAGWSPSPRLLPSQSHPLWPSWQKLFRGIPVHDLIQAVALALDAKRSGNSFVAKCPICKNDKYTLNIWLGDDGKIGLRCYYSILGRCHTIAHVFHLQSLGVDIDQDDITGSKNKPSETWPEIWSAGMGIKGTAADEYLFRRGIDITLLPPVYLHQLKFIPRLKHPTGPRLPVMLGIMRNTLTNADQAIHRTYLNPIGTDKADVLPNKMTLGFPKAGVVKFGEPVNGVIAVGEGIETCLSFFLMFGVNVWCATSVGGLLTMVMRDDIKEVLWVVDNDEPGTIALEEAKKHFKVDIKPMRPSKGFKDFNDELRGQ